MRKTAEKRHNDWKKAIRKRKIINAHGIDYYDNLHQYSKNKIHCSCHVCRGWIKHGHATISDRRKLEEMDAQEEENINE